MPAFADVPWLPTSEQFMQAIEAGSRVGQNREAEINRQNEEIRRRVSFGGMPASNPLADAQANALNEKTQGAQQDQQAAGQAWENHNDLIRRGATPQEAYDQSGLGQFGVRPDDVLGRNRAPVTYKFGNDVVEIDPMTGKSKTVFSSPPKPTALPRYAGPTSVDEFGHPVNVAHLTLPEWARMGPSLSPQVATNQPVASYIGWGGTNTGNQFQPPAAAPTKQAEVVRFTSDGKKAVFDAATKNFLRYAE